MAPVRRLALALVASLGLVACGGGQAASSTTVPYAGIVRTPPLTTGGVSLPEVTASGASSPFSLKAAPGHLLAFYFGYTSCPDLCPTTLSDLKVVKEDLGAQGKVLDVAMETVDPARDTPPVLTSYLAGFFEGFPGMGVHALRTTDPAALAAAQGPLLASSTVTTTSEGKIEVAHTASLYLIDDAGTVLVEWPFGVSWRAMTADVRRIIDEKGLA